MVARSFLNDVRGIVRQSAKPLITKIKRRNGVLSHTETIIHEPTTDVQMQDTAKSFFKVCKNRNYPHQRMLHSLNSYVSKTKKDLEDSDRISDDHIHHRTHTEVSSLKRVMTGTGDARYLKDHVINKTIETIPDKNLVKIESYLHSIQNNKRPHTGVRP